MKQSSKLEKATFAAGCFWCIEAVLRELKGVKSVVSGYSGGEMDNPNYEDVTTGETGRAESVQVEFDPDVITYGELLDVFFRVHDPTQLNKQGNDIGTQYRSVIFYHDEKQKKLAEEYIKELEKKKIYDAPVVTEVAPFKRFYKAEEYHQNYYEKNPDQAYCQIVINPKMEKFRKEFGEKLKDGNKE